MSYDATMKNALVRAAIAATIALALSAATQAQSTDTTTTIKDDAKTVGQAVAHSAKAVGAKAKEGAGKVKAAVKGKPDEPAPKS